MKNFRGDGLKIIDLETLYYRAYILPNIDKFWESIPPVETEMVIESTLGNGDNPFLKLWKESINADKSPD